MYRVYRKRIALSLLVLVPLGFLTKAVDIPSAPWINNHLGGALYVIFWILVFQFVLIRASHRKISLAVLILTSLVECTQLLNTPVLVEIRSSFMGRTLIGNSFNGMDFVYYLGGALVGYLLLLLLFVGPGRKISR